jgi:dTDP-4-dehydrorhamnose reductase
VAVGRPARRRSLEHAIADPVRTGRARVLITGAGGQLGRALQDTFAGDGVLALGHEDWDVTLPAPPASRQTRPPRGRLDGRRRRRGRPAGSRRRERRRHAPRAELGAPLVYYSTDYVFDGTKREPYVGVRRAEPAFGLRPHEAARRGGGRRTRWIVRTSGLFGVTGTNFVRTMLRLGHERDEVAVVARPADRPDVRRPPRGGDEGAARPAVRHLASRRRGDCTWAEFAEAIFEEAGLDTRVRRISTDELGRPAPRPAYSVLRSEKDAPALPHWREGLRACLSRIA